MCRFKAKENRNDSTESRNHDVTGHCKKEWPMVGGRCYSSKVPYFESKQSDTVTSHLKHQLVMKWPMTSLRRARCQQKSWSDEGSDEAESDDNPPMNNAGKGNDDDA
ncbi:hypothetical protein HAX54_017261 [Datura stramonium]|uniref:Uncharacterized protein n=1 Tax=Datura stramonium TaxID=4076 RepID=A0ABS8ULX1_DATST|nr:hypothetical protein [Datura stramonium]